MNEVIEPTIVKACGKPAIIVVRCEGRMDDELRKMMKAAVETACQASPDLKGLPVMVLGKGVSIEIVPMPPEPPSKDVRTLSPGEFSLLKQLFLHSGSQFGFGSMRETAEKLMHAMYERTGVSFEQYT